LDFGICDKSFSLNIGKRLQVKGSEVQGSAQQLVAEAASLIEKETKLKISNLKHQISNKSQISIFNDRNRFGI
jgi:hypothetical protein